MCRVIACGGCGKKLKKFRASCDVGCQKPRQLPAAWPPSPRPPRGGWLVPAGHFRQRRPCPSVRAVVFLPRAIFFLPGVPPSAPSSSFPAPSSSCSASLHPSSSSSAQGARTLAGFGSPFLPPCRFWIPFSCCLCDAYD